MNIKYVITLGKPGITFPGEVEISDNLAGDSDHIKDVIRVHFFGSDRLFHPV